MRPNTSLTTTALPSRLESPGRRAKTAASSSGGASANGAWVKPAFSIDAANEAGAAATTSWPASTRARAKGTIGPR